MPVIGKIAQDEKHSRGVGYPAAGAFCAAKLLDARFLGFLGILGA
jgi:hypothetical protein